MQLCHSFRRPNSFSIACSLPGGEAAFILTRFYSHLPPASVAASYRILVRTIRDDSNHSVAPDAKDVNTQMSVPPHYTPGWFPRAFRLCGVALQWPRELPLFERIFKKKPAPLTGAPPVRRQKTYDAQSGYVYQYYYEGQRPFVREGEAGTEFVFDVSADRKNSAPVSVLVLEEAVHSWENQHGRALRIQRFDPVLASGRIRV